jgi:hypothetical protein
VRLPVLLLLGDAPPQRLHEVDGPAGHGKALLGLRRQAGLPGLKVRQQGLLIAVPEGRRIEGAGLAVENVRGEPEQLGRRRQVWYLVEIILGIAHLIRIAQRGADQALAIRLKRHHPLALAQHNAPQRHQGLAAHRLADHRKGVLPDRIIGGDVIGRIEEALVDLRMRHKAVDVDRVRAGDLDGLQLLIFDEEKLAFADLVAAGLVMSLDDFTGLLVNELLAQPVAGSADRHKPSSSSPARLLDR